MIQSVELIKVRQKLSHEREESLPEAVAVGLFLFIDVVPWGN